MGFSSPHLQSYLFELASLPLRFNNLRTMPTRLQAATNEGKEEDTSTSTHVNHVAADSPDEILTSHEVQALTSHVTLYEDDMDHIF